MSAGLPPVLATLLAEIDSGTLSEGAQATLRRALVAAASGRPIAEILNADSRTRRDVALLALRRRFSQTSPSGAAKAMATALRRYEATAWPHDRKLGAPMGGARLEFDILSCGPAPAWRTILAALQRSPRSAANALPQIDTMDDAEC